MRKNKSALGVMHGAWKGNEKIVMGKGQVDVLASVAWMLDLIASYKLAGWRSFTPRPWRSLEGCHRGRIVMHSYLTGAGWKL